MNPQPEDVLEDATLGSATAVRQEKTIGSLEVGKKADILVARHPAHLHSCRRCASSRRGSTTASPSDIESVMIDGQFVMRDRKILTVDEAAVIAEADKVGQRVWAEVQKSGPIAIPGRPRRR